MRVSCASVWPHNQMAEMQLEQFILTLVISITTGLVVSIATALVTVRLALRRFRDERLWVRRVDAYQTVLVALHHASRHCAAELAPYLSQSEYQPTEAERRKIRAAYSEIYKAIDLGSFLLSDDAVACLENLEKSLQETGEMHKEDYLGYLIDSELDVNDCLKNLRDIAKKDIKK